MRSISKRGEPSGTDQERFGSALPGVALALARLGATGGTALDAPEHASGRARGHIRRVKVDAISQRPRYRVLLTCILVALGLSLYSPGAAQATDPCASVDNGTDCLTYLKQLVSDPCASFDHDTDCLTYARQLVGGDPCASFDHGTSCLTYLQQLVGGDPCASFDHGTSCLTYVQQLVGGDPCAKVDRGTDCVTYVQGVAATAVALVDRECQTLSGTGSAEDTNVSSACVDLILGLPDKITALLATLAGTQGASGLLEQPLVADDEIATTDPQGTAGADATTQLTPQQKVAAVQIAISNAGINTLTGGPSRYVVLDVGPWASPLDQHLIGAAVTLRLDLPIAVPPYWWPSILWDDLADTFTIQQEQYSTQAMSQLVIWEDLATRTIFGYAPDPNTDVTVQNAPTLEPKADN